MIPSLRLRLTAIILIPLLSIAILAGLWQLHNARTTARDVFDRSLLSAAMTVANDVAISGGDALSPRTRDILADTSGGQVFYHVYAPDGVIVAGYATPPVGVPRALDNPAEPTYFEAMYLGQTVSGVRLQTRAEIGGFAGIFTTTVWQHDAVRQTFVQDLVMRSVITIGALILSVALIVWFGVQYGLRPLIDLEQAIARRSSDELSPIRRPVPPEVRGIVRTLNRLFTQVSHSMTAQAEFISNAAHQLRNPIAGVLALAEAVERNPSKTRAQELLTAARETADISQKLLLLERAKTISPHSEQGRVYLGQHLPHWVESFDAPATVAITLNIAPNIPPLWGDAVMLREAILNLLDNACRHGGDGLSKITITASHHGSNIHLNICDNGCGIAQADLPRAKQRFASLSQTPSSGLGLSIVETIVTAHKGQFSLHPLPHGLCARIEFAQEN